VPSRPDRGWWRPDRSDRRGNVAPGTVPGSDSWAPPPGIDIWHVGLDPGASPVRTAVALLGPAERQRARRIRDAHAARRYLAAHGALRMILGRYLGRPGEDVRWDAGANGKPAFCGQDRRWQWSLSRSGGHALLAVTRTAPLGVDLEAIRNDIPESVLACRFLPAQEAAEVGAGRDPLARRTTYQGLLTRKEACAKASGGRFLDALRLDVLRPGAVQGIGRLAGHWMLRDLPVPTGFAGAVALAGDELGQVRLLDWAWGS